MLRRILIENTLKTRLVESDKGSSNKEAEFLAEVADKVSKLKKIHQDRRHWQLVQAKRLIARHSQDPLEAVGIVLGSKSLTCPEPVSQIVNDARCGLERKLASNQGEGRCRITKAAALGATPVILAVLASRPEVVEALLACGAEVNATDTSGMSALHYAAEMGDDRSIELIVGKGANINAKSKAGTPLIIAARKGCLATVKLLVSLGAKTSTAHAEDTPLVFAARVDNVALAELLLDLGADPNETAGYSGPTALHLAAQAGHTRIVDILVSRGVDINVRTISSKKTPLHVAVAAKRHAVVKLLGLKGCDLEAEDADSMTPLQLAVIGGDFALVDALVSLGASISHVTRRYGQIQWPLLLALELAKIDLFSYFLSQGATVDVRNDAGEGILHLAAKQPNAIATKAIEALLDHGVCIEAVDNAGRSAVRVTCYPFVRQMLLDEGAT